MGLVTSAAPERRGLVRASLVPWGTAALTLLLGGAGLFAVTSSGTTTSLTRMGLAAAVLALLTAVVAVAVVPAAGRSAGRRWSAALGVPVLVGAATAALVWRTAGGADGLLAAVPWLCGAVLGGALGPFLPDLSPAGLRERRRARHERATW